jgi:hypothetical protein
MREKIDPAQMEIHTYGDAAALYIDGKLHAAQHDVNELVLELLGVTVVDDPAFMQGQTKWSGVAKTLDDVKAYAKARDERLDKARGMREEAVALLKMAEELEAGLK